MRGLELPTPQVGATEAWVDQHLLDLAGDEAPASPRFRGGQTAADAALAAFDVRGYAARRNEVLPRSRRGASALSPYIRHGLLTLPRAWDAVEGGPARDVRKFRDELLWQEYARHLYARLGERTRKSLRFDPPERTAPIDPWARNMACMSTNLEELETDGWVVNQTRMWMASQWTVRHGARWQDGEDRFFRELLDGSRAANRLGWQWTTGAGSAKAYGFSRWQVQKRAPKLCASCALSRQCPIQEWPSEGEASRRRTPPEGLRRDDDLEATAGPRGVMQHNEPEAVWITAESLGDDDPALRAHRDLPVIFVFDAPLLERLHLSRKRLAFLAETLADLGTRRSLRVVRGKPAECLEEVRVATTFAPVPGFRRIAERIEPAELHPWTWLAWPHDRSLQSFSAWRKSLD
ncbi:MAG: FAD-binding domain-containing protein [Acidobacteriota bacterium]